jgi:hypothetical protein
MVVHVALFGEAGVGGLCARPCILNLNYTSTQGDWPLHQLRPAASLLSAVLCFLGTPTRTRPWSSSAIPAQFMSVPAAVLPICQPSLLPPASYHVVTKALSASLVNTA